MSHNLLDLLTPARHSGAQHINGVVTGVVTNNQDPEGLGRVRVRFPWLSQSDESSWARVAAPMAGKERGLYSLPEVDDEVLVAFEQGDPRFPYVLGALWSSPNPPPETNDDGDNNIRVIKSRSGHIIRLDDSDGAEKIEIVDKSGSNSITINTADNSISIQSTDGKLKLRGNGIEISSQAEIKIEATQTMDLKASMVNIN